MNILYIGEETNASIAVQKFANKSNNNLVFADFVSSQTDFVNTIDRHSECDDVIIDIDSMYSLDSLELYEAVKYLTQNYDGNFVCYSVGNKDTKKIDSCRKAGINNFVLDTKEKDIINHFIKIYSGKNTPTTQPIQFSDNNVETPVVATVTPNIPVVQNNKSVTTIGILGVIPRIGTTTQALHLVRSLQACNKKVCYVQDNNTSFVDCLLNYYSDVNTMNDGSIVYDNLSIYPSTEIVDKSNYDYIVSDFGSTNDIIPSAFFDCNIKFVVCGSTAEEAARLTMLVEQLNSDKNINYIFSFTDKSEEADVKEMMCSHADRTYFAPISADSFKLQNYEIPFYCNLLNLELPFTDAIPDEKKKKFSLFKRKGK